MVTQLLVCDVGKEKSDDIFYVQGEKGRELIFDVINSFLDSSPSLSGYTATIHILKSDGNFTIANMTIDVNNKLHYTLTENDCAVSGNGIYDISLTKNNELIYSSHGYYIGDSRAVSDDVVNSVSVAYGVPFPEGFQEKLTAGDNITIDENNVISASGEQSFNYNDASNKPSINGVTLQGNKSTSDLHIPTYTAGENIDISQNGVISATDTKYTAGENVSIVNGVISAQDTTYTAGDNITIENGVISATGGGGSYTELTKQATIPSSQITLADSIANYDFIVLCASSYVGDIEYLCTSITCVADIVAGYRIGVTNENIPLWFIVDDNTHISLGYISGNWRKLSMYGLKL